MLGSFAAKVTSVCPVFIHADLYPKWDETNLS